MTQREFEGTNPSSNIQDRASALRQDIKSVSEKLSAEPVGDKAQHAVAGAKDAVAQAVAGAKDVAAHLQQEGASLLGEARDAASSSYRSARDYASEEAHLLTERARRAGSAGADYARRAGVSTAGFVSHNAVPLTLIGLGIGWLTWSLRSQNQRRADSLYDADFDSNLEGEYPLRERFGAASGRLEGVASSARDVAEQARQRLGALSDRASESASSIAERASHGARAIAERASHGASAAADRAAHGLDVVRSRVTHTASHLGEQASELSHEGREKLRLASLRTRDFADENPLLVGAIAVAAGVGVGLLLPTTQPENRLLGETRDRWLGDAKGLLGDARGVLDEARAAARDTAGQVGQRARETAEDVRRELADSRLSH